MSEAKRIGAYLLDRPIGSGGMGEVWLARHEVLGRPTVLKKLRRELASNEEIAERFEREARTAAAVHERQIVVVYDAFRFRGELYIAQEFVDGADLRSILDRVERLPPRFALQIAIELARALEAVHAAGTIHRDLKPGNLLISRSGDVKLADFGIALERSGPDLTQCGVVVGTPAYMSPEQLSGERADARSDLFSFGAVLYEMLTGKPPYPDPEEPEALSRLSLMRKERYVPPRKRYRDIPRALSRIVRACLRAKPTRRPVSATDLRQRLEAYGPFSSSARARAELAAYLWERGVFERRSDETVVQIAPVFPTAPRGRRLLPAALAAAAVLAITLLSVGLVAPSRFEPWLRALSEARLAWSPPARVTVRAPAGSRLRIDDGPALDVHGADPVELDLEVGEHRLILSRSGRKDVERTLVLGPSEQLELTFD